MRLFVRLRALLVVVAMVLSGAAVLLAASVSATAAPQDLCEFDDVAAQHAQATPAQANDASFTLQPDSYFTVFNTPLEVPNPGVLGNDTLPESYETYVYDYPDHGDLNFFGGVEDGNGGFYYCLDRISSVRISSPTGCATSKTRSTSRRAEEDDSCQIAVVTITVGAAGGCTSGFPDVPNTNPFCPDVAYLTTYGFAKGYSDGNVHPTAPVNREAAAAVLQRFANSTVPACKSAPFPDVPVSSPFCASIAYLVAHKVVAGFSDGNFLPTALVTREGIASFIYKLANPGKAVPACTKAPFSDVPVSNPFCGAITWLVSHGIADGNADGTFHPTGTVLRQELARFVHRLGTLGG